MCELAILDPEQYSPEQLRDSAMEIYTSMRSSLGIVVASLTDGQYEYDIYKAVRPDEAAVEQFLRDTTEDAYRVIIHGRLATTGAVNEQNAHPLAIDCPECDVDFVLHNGCFWQEEVVRREHVSDGHEYSTPVDSEIIAHEFGTVPTEPMPDAADKFREPCIVLLNSDSIYVQTDGYSYNMTGELELACSRRDVGPARDENEYQNVVAPA
jgi:glutamate synthase domain-containing protein 1